MHQSARILPLHGLQSHENKEASLSFFIFTPDDICLLHSLSSSSVENTCISCSVMHHSSAWVSIFYMLF